MTTLKAKIKESGFKLAELAAALKVDKATITKWHQNRVPAERVLDVARITRIPKEELRPDLYPVQERA